MRILMLGPPGAGKGTIGKRIACALEIPHFVMGDVIREHVKNKTSFGMLAAERINKGNLIPDERVVSLFFKMTERNRRYTHGAVLDGFPRTLLQIKLLHARGWDFDAIICLTATKRTLIKRLSARRVCPECRAVYNLIYDPPKKKGICDHDDTPLEIRDDDTPDVIRHRLEVYKRATTPILNHYKTAHTIIKINTERTPQEISRIALAKLRKQLMHKNSSIRPRRKHK